MKVSHLYYLTPDILTGDMFLKDTLNYVTLFLWDMLCRLQEKERKEMEEIVEEMKERDNEGRKKKQE